MYFASQCLQKPGSREDTALSIPRLGSFDFGCGCGMKPNGHSADQGVGGGALPRGLSEPRQTPRRPRAAHLSHPCGFNIRFRLGFERFDKKARERCPVLFGKLRSVTKQRGEVLGHNSF